MRSAGPHWWPAYIGIGSNLETPLDQVRSAIDDLAEIPRSIVAASSSLYRSAPLGPQDQPDFVNAVAAMVTQLPPLELLHHLQRIEGAHGRQRDGDKHGPRTLDLDVLVYGSKKIETSDLTVPHTGIAERNFVLLPLIDVAPYLQVPGLGSVARLVAALGSKNQGIDKIE